MTLSIDPVAHYKDIPVYTDDEYPGVCIAFYPDSFMHYNSKLTCFYAHCKSIYNTPQEKRDIKLLENIGFIVLNPNKEEYEKEYKKEGLSFSNELLDRCDIVAFRGLLNGSIASGVGYEIKQARDKGLPVFELPTFSGREWLDYDQTVLYLQECGER